jgi:hypothetical protein
MPNQEQEKQNNGTLSGALNKLELSGAFGPIENKDEYQERLRKLPPDEKQLAEESSRLADLCQYFSERQMDIPPRLLEQMQGLSKLSIPERVRILMQLNRSLTEYLHTVGEDTGIH